MPTLNIDQLVTSSMPTIQNFLAVLWQIIKIVLGLGLLLYFWFYTTFKVRVLERRFTKGGRVIVTLKRAKKIFEKKLGHPQIQFFGVLGFKGKKINEPPADCQFPFTSLIVGNIIMYDYIVKDGLYYPITNAVLGRKYIIDTPDRSLQQDDSFMVYARENGLQVASVGNPETIIYSIEGSGLEVSRDYEAEQATLNNLINAAEKYKNRKPIEIAAMYGLMIIICVGAFVTLIYAFYKSGQIIDAVNQGWEIFKEIGGTVATSKSGPG